MGKNKITLKEHLLSLREADDRRYAEVDVEREKALKIKETADLAALNIASATQRYKDDKANELREQIGSERNLYASKEDLLAAIEKIEALVAPALKYAVTEQGRRVGISTSASFILGIPVAILTLLTIILTVIQLRS